MQTHFHSLRLSRPVVIVVTTLLATLLLSAVSVSAQTTDPVSVVKAAVDALNRGDVEAVMATYADDATLKNPAGSYSGKEQVRRGVQEDVSIHVRIDASNFQAAGDKVTFAAKRSDDRVRRLGIDAVDATVEVIVQGGKIKSLTSTLSPESAARVQAALAAAQQQPQTLPRTGGEVAPNTIWLVVLGVVALMSGLGLMVMRRARRV